MKNWSLIARSIYYMDVIGTPIDINKKNAAAFSLTMRL